jgi:hypothetical protein
VVERFEQVRKSGSLGAFLERGQAVFEHRKKASQPAAIHVGERRRFKAVDDLSAASAGSDEFRPPEDTEMLRDGSAADGRKSARDVAGCAGAIIPQQFKNGPTRGVGDCGEGVRRARFQ